MAGNATVIWQPEGLTRALRIAFSRSLGDARTAAQARNPWPSQIGASVRQIGTDVAYIRGTGRLAHIAELGRRGEYQVTAGTRVRGRGETRRLVTKRSGAGAYKALKLKDASGGPMYQRTVTPGPLKAQPYIRPAAVLWSRGLYQRRAAAAIAGFASGIGAGLAASARSSR